MRFLIFLVIFSYSSNSWSSDAKKCNIADEYLERLATKIADVNGSEFFKNLPRCYKVNRELVLKVLLDDPTKFIHADQSLRDDEIFINRILKVHPDILRYVSYDLRNNKRFMEQATYIQRDSLLYASLKLRDNKSFMTKMIDIDSRNYFFASYRLKSDEKIAKIAFQDNGMLIESAPDIVKSNYKLAKIAINSNKNAFEFLSKELRNNKDLKKLSKTNVSAKDLDELKNFLQTHYIDSESQDGFAVKIINQGKFFSSKMLVDRKYITKWRYKRKSKYINDKEKLSMIAVENRNHQQSWRNDFANYPLLRDKVTRFFKKHNIDDITIDNMRTTYFWAIKDDLPTVAFNIYSLRTSQDEALGPEFSDISSLTIITQKQGERWNLSVIEVIFSSEVRLDMSYLNGHKKYILWDLYKISEDDKSPKVIFKVEDRFKEYFEVYEEKSGGKYNKILTYDPAT